ncbi:type I restriction endonuclease [Marinicauda algicola]|uniref:type I restriction endonuclease n=1 Tax=Marinicauda algicola TaxID=2029849 RepID=UPI0019D237D2
MIEEVEYSTKNGNRIDVVLYVNGLPVATMELKNRLTGTTHKHAEKQYKTDRSPSGEPLLTFKRGALVHFAVDQDYVSMATRLRKPRSPEDGLRGTEGCPSAAWLSSGASCARTGFGRRRVHDLARSSRSPSSPQDDA